MKFIIFLSLLVATTFSSYGQLTNPFLRLKFDKVVMYDFEASGEKGLLIFDDNGKFAQKILKEVQLNAKTIATLNMKLGNKKSYGNGTAACFDPHLGFVYFLRGKIVGQIAICLGCNRLSSTIDIPAQKQGRQGSGKDVYYMSNGPSKTFRHYINGLLIKNKFSNQIQPGSPYDQ